MSPSIGAMHDYRYTLAHVSRIFAIETASIGGEGSKWCRIIPLCHGVDSRNRVVLPSVPKPLSEVLTAPLRATWKPCRKCYQIATELALQEATQ